MAIYTIKTLNKSNIGMKVSESEEKRFISLPFTVTELNYSDNVLLIKEDFNLTNVKKQIKIKIKAELARLAEYEEYTIEI